MTSGDVSPTDTTKRNFLRKATYVVPAVLTLAAAPSFASAGSNSTRAKKPRQRLINPTRDPKNARRKSRAG